MSINSELEDSIQELLKTLETDAPTINICGKTVVYHGSKERNLVPTFGKGRRDNDYGIGFYTTPDKELGKEWAWSVYTKGDEAYLYTYEIDLSDLMVLDFTTMDSLRWVAELVTNRKVNTGGRDLLADRVIQLQRKYKVDTSFYDVIVGYRADDSYFSYIADFISGALSREMLDEVIMYGNLGKQVFIKSEKAFESLKQVKQPETVDDSYREQFMRRMQHVNEKYHIIQSSGAGMSKGKHTIDYYLN